MPRKASYPEWVTKHLEKGIYVNRVGDKYYLYRAHSERKEGYRNPVRIFDGYVGTVTEKEGLVPAKTPQGISSDEISTLDYAVPVSVCACTEKILMGLKRTYRRSGTLIYVCSVLFFLYGVYSDTLYESSWLSLRFPGVSFPDQMSASTLSGIERGGRMIADKVDSFYGEDWKTVRAVLAPVVLIRYKGELHYPSLSDAASEAVRKYDLPVCQENKEI